jgi:hypothetical protein
VTARGSLVPGDRLESPVPFFSGGGVVYPGGRWYPGVSDTHRDPVPGNGYGLEGRVDRTRKPYPAEPATQPLGTAPPRGALPVDLP